jgi:CMP/dCMP kinase
MRENGNVVSEQGGLQPVIAMDGPAGSGKSTVADQVAEALDYIHADSGAIYRTLTLAYMERIGAGETAAAFGQLLAGHRPAPEGLGCRVELADGRQKAWIGAVEIGDRIRTREVTERIRYIADDPACRAEVNRLLREFARSSPLVVDGRDIGTVVFPDTPWKFFIEASARVRAERRLGELAGRGMETVEIAELEAEIIRRDEQDRNREIGALRQAPDAILIDTSELTVEAVVQRVLAHLQILF